jgi:hypothetical protein
MNELTPEIIAQRIKSMLAASSESIATENIDEKSNNIPEAPSFENVPPLREGEFLITLKFNSKPVLFCMRELFWHENQDIETYAFRKNDDELFFSGEFERREILKKAIIWVHQSGTTEYNDVKGSMLSKINADVVLELWNKFQEVAVLNAAEASAIYNAAYHYFKGESQTRFPVPSLVIDVDFWLKGVQWTREDFRKVTAANLERIQLILAGRADALKVTKSAQNIVHDTNAPAEKLSPEMIATFPPHIRDRMKSSL